ncbi:MAG: hypothetical protein OEU09_21475, partial [Rhodospirillales bacterium]|nr:hypothetical protein [Rhodospirillales bacterium]
MPEVKASPRRGFLLCRRAVRAGLASGVLLFAAYSIGLAAEDPLGAPAPDRVEAEPNEESEAEPGPRYKDGIYLLDGGFYTSFAENSWRILSGPFHYDRDEWITVGIVLSVTGALML